MMLFMLRHVACWVIIKFAEEFNIKFLWGSLLAPEGVRYDAKIALDNVVHSCSTNNTCQSAPKSLWGIASGQTMRLSFQDEFMTFVGALELIDDIEKVSF